MDAAIESAEAEEVDEELETLSQGQQVLLDLMKEKHGLAEEQSFAMWLRIPLMASKQKWVLAATVLISALAFILLAASVPIWALAIVPVIGIFAVLASAERDVLSLGPDGLLLHKPIGSDLDEGTAVSAEWDGGNVTVDGVSYHADKLALEKLEELMA